MQVSIVIPVYQRQELGLRALGSALAQQGPWVEIIVVDDASPVPFVLPDDMAGDARVRLMRLDANRGAAGARNAGIQAARGSWIVLLDSDDTWTQDKLARQCAFAARHEAQNGGRPTLYATGFRQSSGQARVLDRIPAAAATLRDLASGCWYSPGSTALFSKRTFEAVGPYDETLKRLEDIDWGIRLALADGELAVAPFIGAILEIGPRPGFARVDEAARRLEAKWLPDERFASHSGARSGLSAALDIERAAAFRSDGNTLAMAGHLMRSFALRPRTSLHVKRWWTAPD